MNIKLEPGSLTRVKGILHLVGSDGRTVLCFWDCPCAPEIGDTVTLWVNQAWREADVLARIETRVLVEYEMPNGSSALRVLGAEEIAEGGVGTWQSSSRGQSVSYVRVPLEWLRRLVETGTRWTYGNPQGTRLSALEPAELLAKHERLSRRVLTANA